MPYDPHVVPHRVSAVGAGISPLRAALVPLRVVVALGAVLLVALAWWTWASTREDTSDGREPIVFWANGGLGEDVYAVVAAFEREFPRYRVILGSSASRDPTADAQRLLSTIAGGVPPDLVWFDRFAIGEYAARGAFEDLAPWLAKQDAADKYRLDLDQYYPFTVQEAMYRRPGTDDAPGLYGIPTTTDLRLLYCNADHLRQAGLVDERGEPRPPRTWEEQREYAVKLSRWRVPNDPTSGMTRLGFSPNFGNSWLYLYAWQAGGELLSPDRARVTLDSPPVVRALRYMAEVYDDLGGYPQVNAFQQSFQAGPLDPFLRGQVSMKIDGNWSMIGIADWKPDMDFIVAPAPIPADRVAAGEKPVTWAGGYSYVVPSTAKHKAGAIELMKYLRSWDVISRLEAGKREQQHSTGRLYLPAADANRAYFERLISEAITGRPEIPKRIQEGYGVALRMLPNTLIRPVSPVGQLLWTQHVSAYEAGVGHVYAAQAKDTGDDEYRLALAAKQVDVQRQLDAVLRPPPPTVVDWTPYLLGYAGLVACAFAAMGIAFARGRGRTWRGREVGAALLFASPWFIGFIFLVGGPILFSIVFSFTSYDGLAPARYVGTANYAAVAGDPVFAQSLWNTAYMTVRIPLGMAVSLAIALLLNRGLRGIGAYRTTFYLPTIMPMVASSLLWIWLFNPAHGALNEGLRWLFETGPLRALEWAVNAFREHPVRFAPPLWLQDENWSKPGLILMNLWSAGGGMIIWLAGLQAIPQHLYEAAAIDGAGRWRKFITITLPMLSPYILFNLVMGLIGTMQVFGEAFIITQGGPNDSTLFYAYNLFNQAFRYFRMGYASALAWILFGVVLVLTLIQLRLSKKWVTYDQA